MLTEKEIKHTVLKLRETGNSIAAIHSVTGLSITKICEVIYEKNQADIFNDGQSVSWDGIF